MAVLGLELLSRRTSNIRRHQKQVLKPQAGLSLPGLPLAAAPLNSLHLPAPSPFQARAGREEIPAPGLGQSGSVALGLHEEFRGRMCRVWGEVGRDSRMWVSGGKVAKGGEGGERSLSQGPGKQGPV